MSKKIIVVEDDVHNLTLFVDLLQAQGYEVIGIHDGRQALDAIRRDKPDLIIMDLLLNDGLSGAELVEELKQDPGFHTPIVGSSSQRTHEAACFYAICEAALPKPISLSQAVETVRELVAG